MKKAIASESYPSFMRMAARKEAAAEKSIWSRRNTLKSPDSDEQNQANPSDFIWRDLDKF
jgi:hypothetical protein